jgi:hypothetical protein
MKSNEKHKTISRINFICINEWHVGIIYFLFFSLYSRIIFSKTFPFQFVAFKKTKIKNENVVRVRAIYFIKLEGEEIHRWYLSSNVVVVVLTLTSPALDSLRIFRFTSSHFFINIIRMFFKLTSAKWIFLSNILTPAQIESYSE